jgi:hypothetical protein
VLRPRTAAAGYLGSNAPRRHAAHAFAGAHDNTDAAVLKIVDAGWFGGVGLIALPDLIIASASEGWLGQDGSNRISLIDSKEPQNWLMNHRT